MKVNIYLALTAVFAAAALISKTFLPRASVMAAWNGLLAITFRYLASRARWEWQGKRTTVE